jgi:uncharacterized membrane protein YidH (DUF202 family)
MLVEKIVDEEKFNMHHAEQISPRSQKDVFFIWLLIIFISVIAAHFVLNMTDAFMTGFVTAAENPSENIILLLDAFMVVFVVVLMVGLMYNGITKKDHDY